MVVEFGQKAYSQIAFYNEGTNEMMDVRVIDHHPYAEEHFEGRRSVEVSIELFVELMGAVGFRPVTAQQAEELLRQAEEEIRKQKEVEQ